MNTELDQIADTAGETATTVAEVAFGQAGLKRTAQRILDPIGSARKQVKGPSARERPPRARSTAASTRG